MLGFTGLDVITDIRALSHDMINWEWSWSHASKTALDAIGLIPVIGSVKNADEAAFAKDGDEALDSGGQIVKHGDQLVEGAGKLIKIGDDVVELNSKNIVGTNYSKVKPTQDWINMDEVNRYVQRLKAGETLSPIEVYEVSGKGYFIQDKVIPGTGPVGLPNWMDVVPGLPD